MKSKNELKIKSFKEFINFSESPDILDSVDLLASQLPGTALLEASQAGEFNEKITRKYVVLIQNKILRVHRDLIRSTSQREREELLSSQNLLQVALTLLVSSSGKGMIAKKALLQSLNPQ